MGPNNGVLAQDSACLPFQCSQVCSYNEVKRNKLHSTCDLETYASQMNRRRQ